MSQVFFPPEMASQAEFESIAEEGPLGGKTELLRQLYFQRTQDNSKNPSRDKRLVQLVLDHAKRVIAHPTRPTISKTQSFMEEPHGELELEESLEEDPFLNDPEALQVQTTMEKPFQCVMILDASSSMTGEKHLLASVAVAVLLLEVAPQDSSLVVFASEANPIKKLLSQESRESTILRFLQSQPRGFTNIARGLEVGLEQWKQASAKKRKIGLIATDGRTTEGDDPVEVAAKFDFLVVLHLHGPGSHLEASQAIAQAGHGICLEVEKFEELPRKLYDALKLLSRK